MEDGRLKTDQRHVVSVETEVEGSPKLTLRALVGAG